MILIFARIHMAPFSDEYLYVEMANKVLNHHYVFITFSLSNA
jgi:hypothetical protein